MNALNLQTIYERFVMAHCTRNSLLTHTFQQKRGYTEATRLLEKTLQPQHYTLLFFCATKVSSKNYYYLPTSNLVWSTNVTRHCENLSPRDKKTRTHVRTCCFHSKTITKTPHCHYVICNTQTTLTLNRLKLLLFHKAFPRIYSTGYSRE